MHEISICYEVIKTVSEIAKENNVKEVDTVILEIGELSTVIPKYMEECWPVAVDGTAYEKTKLEIETIVGLGRCNLCDRLYPLLNNEGVCDQCGAKNFQMVSGKEFNLKEIIVPEE